MARPKAGTTFWDRVYGLAEAEGDCLIFRGCVNDDGYGRIVRNGRLVFVHREVWARDHGPIPAMMCICHTCDKPACIEPSHLWLGTHADNMADRKRKGREAIRYGSQNPVSKLKEEDIPAIRAALRTSESVISIARRYAVTDGVIFSIRARRTWSHVPEA